MKSRLLIIVTTFFVSSIILYAVGIWTTYQSSVTIWEFRYGPKTIPGSSGGGYLSYDGVWIFFESGTVLFAAGILSLIWKKRK